MPVGYLHICFKGEQTVFQNQTSIQAQDEGQDTAVWRQTLSSPRAGTGFSRGHAVPGFARTLSSHRELFGVCLWRSSTPGAWACTEGILTCTRPPVLTRGFPMWAVTANASVGTVDKAVCSKAACFLLVCNSQVETGNAKEKRRKIQKIKFLGSPRNSWNMDIFILAQHQKIRSHSNKTKFLKPQDTHSKEVSLDTQ